jgi:DNA-binding NarL/FixJ family response regulator
MVTKTRVVLADDHPQMRARVREALEADDFESLR